MGQVISKDGTAIVFDRSGQGAPLILVDGAICYRAFGPMGALAPLLEQHFTVYQYDRRGRGESGNTLPFAPEREIEDIDALIQEAGGATFVYGISSGAALALEAALKLGGKIRKLALYEPPYNPAEQQQWQDYHRQLTKALAANRPGDAVTAFMTLVGTPADQIEEMRHAPVWPMFEAVAPTLAYDAAALGGDDRSIPVERAASVTVPTLVMAGSATYPFIIETARALATAIPNAQYRALEGQTHDVAPDVIAPVLTQFFLS